MKHHRLQVYGDRPPVQVPDVPENTREWLSIVAYDLDGDTESTVDLYAFEDGYCNGPRCVDCGYAACHHCTPMWWSLKNCPGEDTQHEEEMAADYDRLVKGDPFPMHEGGRR